MYTNFGSRVRFRIINVVRHVDALDMVWVIARIKLSTGEETLASFPGNDFYAIRDRSVELEARMMHQVFNNSLDIHSALEPDPKSVLNLAIHPRFLYGKQLDTEFAWEELANDDGFEKPLTDSAIAKTSRARPVGGNPVSAFGRVATTMLGFVFGSRRRLIGSEEQFLSAQEGDIVVRAWEALGYVNAIFESGRVLVTTAQGRGNVAISRSRISFHGEALGDVDSMDAALAFAKANWGGRVSVQGDENAKLELWAHAVVAGVEVVGYAPPAHRRHDAEARVATIQQWKAYATADDVHYGLGGAPRPGWRHKKTHPDFAA